MTCPFCLPGANPRVPHTDTVDHDAPKGTRVVAHARTDGHVFLGVIRRRLGSWARVRDLATGDSHDLTVFECFIAPKTEVNEPSPRRV